MGDKPMKSLGGTSYIRNGNRYKVKEGPLIEDLLAVRPVEILCFLIDEDSISMPSCFAFYCPLALACTVGILASKAIKSCSFCLCFAAQQAGVLSVLAKLCLGNRLLGILGRICRNWGDGIHAR